MTDVPEAPRTAGGAAFEPIAAFLREAAEAQSQAMSMAQGWSMNVMAAYREQMEEYNAMLQSVSRSLRAMEELVESQTKAAKALGESLDASRQLVDTAVASNQKSLERVETLVTGMVDQVNGQLKALRDQAQVTESMVTGPFAAQNAAYLKMARDWMDTFNSYLGGEATKRPEPDDEEREGEG
jgi:DNA repair exonuclease SbcCD ATPase subunit